MSAFCLPLYERNRKTGKSYQICLSELNLNLFVLNTLYLLNRFWDDTVPIPV